MSDTIHAPPDSLLGQLQRGRGLGFLRLIREPQPVAHRLLTHCILQDPRIDYQCENRSDYYAELALRVGLPLEPLANRIREDDGCEEHGLTWKTLRALSRRGSREAAEILLEDCRTYQDWTHHVESLVSFPDPEVTVRLAGIIESRFPTAIALQEALQYAFLDKPEWQVLGNHSARIREIVSSPNHRATRREQADAFRFQFTSLDLPGLLDFADNWKRIFGLRRFIEAAVSPDDLGFLQSQVVLEHRERAVGALWALAKIADPSLFGWLRDIYRANADLWRPLRCALQDAMVALPAQTVLPLAREWFDHDDSNLSDMADALMKVHAAPEDLSLLRSALQNSLGNEPETSYRICDLATAMERLEGVGPVPELGLAFETALHSCARWYLVPAMRSTHPESFQDRFSEECLWDCEDDVQLAGAEVVSLGALGVPPRLKELSAAPWVDSEVRETASLRLKETSTQTDAPGIGPG
ncbi:MAG: hypothetical protein U1G08_15110 [Verrucomicrobiota bacterium]